MSDDGQPIKVLASIGNPGTTEADNKGVVFYRLPADQLPRKEAGNVLGAVAGIFPDATLMFGMANGDRPGTYWLGLNHLLWGKAFEQALIAQGVKGVSKKLSLPGSNPNPLLKHVITPSWDASARGFLGADAARELLGRINKLLRGRKG